MIKQSDYEKYAEWKNWNHFFSPRTAERRLYESDLKEVRLEEKKFLDIGFGNGALLAWAREKGALVFGVEIQEFLRNEALKNGVTAYENLTEIAPASVDIVCLFDVLEHIPRDQLQDFIAEIRRICAPGSTIVARIPNCQSFLGLINQFGDPTHITMLSGPLVESYFRKAGWARVYSREAADIIESSDLKYWLFRPVRTLSRYIFKLVLRLAWSTGNTLMSANVVVFAHD
jgi:2-polyprenyl-3-methyl-5-hydroxy-6-metoxy-1,4-benzoquinol methylase